MTRDDARSGARTLDAVLDRVAAEYAETLAPAIERVWRDEVDELRRDLGIWVQKRGRRAGLAAGVLRVQLRAERRRPRSAQPAGSGRWSTAASCCADRSISSSTAPISICCASPITRPARTARIPTSSSAAARRCSRCSTASPSSRGSARRSFAGRLFYATTVGGFVEHEIPINDYTRGQGLQVLEIIDRAVETGFLPAAPAERACTWCDFRPVCGPREEERTKRKARERLADLEALRSMR